MYYYITAIALITLFLITIYYVANKRDKNNKSFKILKVNANDIDRKILLKFAKYEKFIYLHGFTKRILLEYKNKNQTIYRAYYYNVLNGVHLYLEYNPKIKDKFNYLFATKFIESEFITYNNSYIDKIEEITENKSFEIYPKASMEELYNTHLKDRQRVDEEIIFNRLTPNELICSRDNTQQQEINIDKKEPKKLSILLKTLLLITILIPTGYYYNKLFNKTTITKTIKVEKKTKKSIKNLDKELKEFNKKIKEFKELSNIPSNYKKETLSNSLTTIDKYLQNSKIIRTVGKPTKILDNKILPFSLTQELEELYKWHNGIEKFIPFRDFYSKEMLIDNYKNSQSNYIILFGNKDKSEGLAYNIKDKAIYEYDAISKKAANKEFYNIYHLLSVISNAYKVGAFYDDKEFINIDIKKFLNVYRNNLNNKDKTKYKKLLAYLKDKAIQYKIYGNKRVKMALLQEIDKLYDKKLLKSLYTFIYSKDSQIKAKAIEIVGKIGDKNSINILMANLKDKNSRVKDFTLMALANIVDENDKNLLKDIYPLLDSNSTFVRLSAYKVIEKIASKDSLALLREKFNKEDSKVKIGIIRALAEIGTKEDIKLLGNYLKKLPPINKNIGYSEYIRGSKPSPIILNYELSRAIENINQREKSGYKISAKY